MVRHFSAFDNAPADYFHYVEYGTVSTASCRPYNAYFVFSNATDQLITTTRWWANMAAVKVGAEGDHDKTRHQLILYGS